MDLPISIIIPTYNRAHLITETLDSILAQTFTHWECIVVDDGSTDSTTEILTSYVLNDDRIKYYHRPKNRLKGASSCRNYGFELSRGKYINWFDDDDVMNDDYLEHVNQKISQNNFDLIFVNYYTKVNGAIVSGDIKSNNYIKDFYTHKLSAYLHRSIFKKEFIQNLRLNESLIIYEDWEFIIKAFLKRPTMVIINDCLYYYRVHDNNITNTIKIERIYLSNSFNKLIGNITSLIKKEGLFDIYCQEYLLKTVNNYLKFSLPNRKFLNSFNMIYIAFKNLNLSSIIKNYKVFLNYFKALIGFKIFKKGYAFLLQNNLLLK